MHLSDLTTLKAYINKTDTANDTILDTLQSYVDNRITNICNQQILLTTRVYKFAGTGTNFVSIPNFPVRTVIGLAQGGTLPTAPGGTGYTTVTSGATSATQTVGSNVGMLANDTLYFQGSNQYGIIQSIPVGTTSVVLTAPITTLTGENVFDQGLQRTWTPVTQWFELQYIDEALGIARLFYAGGYAWGLNQSGIGYGNTAFTAQTGRDQNWKLTYTYGYQATAVSQLPGDIQRVALEMCDILWKNSDIKGVAGSRLGVSSVSWTNVETTTNTFGNMMNSWCKLLRPFTIQPSP